MTDDQAMSQGDVIACIDERMPRRQQVQAARSGQLLDRSGTDLWVMADFHATAMAGLQPGRAVSLTVDALQDRRLHGQVDGLSPATASEFSLIAGSAGGDNVAKIVQRLPVRILIDPGQGRGGLRPGVSVVGEGG